MYSAVLSNGFGCTWVPGRSTPKSIVISYDLDSFACIVSARDHMNEGFTLKCIVPTTRSPLFTASGSGNSNRACLFVSIHSRQGAGTYCQCVRIAVYQFCSIWNKGDVPSGPVDKVTWTPPFGAGGVGSGFNGFEILCHGHSAG